MDKTTYYKSNCNENGNLDFTVIEGYSGLRADLAITKILKIYSRNKIQKWINSGNILINKKRITVKKKLISGEIITLNKPKEILENLQPEKIKLDVVFEDDDVLVLNKPNDLVMHPGNGNTRGTLLNGLLHYIATQKYLPRGGIVHRLDKNTTGLLVVAKNLISYNSLVNQLHNRTVKREYDAVVCGSIATSGKIDQPIGRNKTNRVKMAVNIKGKPSVTNYIGLKINKFWSHIRCNLVTGRTHQIRVHMTAINHPLIGDKTYGKINNEQMKNIIKNIEFNRQALHASRLSFKHPTKRTEISFRIGLPDDMLNLIKNLEAIKND